MSNTLDGSYPSEPLTSDPDESSDETAPESTTTSSTTSRTIPRELDLDSLSPRGEAIKLLLADEMSDGYNLSTLASELGLSPSSASAYLTELRSELELQTGSLPDLNQEEFDALKESIKQDGVQIPIVIGRHMLIDGRHRWRASLELGLKEIPAIFVSELTKDQERERAISVNVIRRQLTRDQRQALIRAELRRDWSRSSRQIASICGVSAPTVESVRDRMRVEAEASPSADAVKEVETQVQNLYTPPSREEDVRVGPTGQIQKAYPEGRGPAVSQQERPLGYVVIEQPGRYAVYKDGSGLRAERV